MKWFQGSPLMRYFLCALGAKVGDDALIGEIEIGAVDLVTIGAGASIGSKVRLGNARVEGNELIIGPIEIGEDAYIGSSCMIAGKRRHRGKRRIARPHLGVVRARVSATAKSTTALPGARSARSTSRRSTRRPRSRSPRRSIQHVHPYRAAARHSAARPAADLSGVLGLRPGR